MEHDWDALPLMDMFSEEHMIIHRLAKRMGIRIRNRMRIEILSDIERYVECATYAKNHNPVGVLSPHA